MSESPESWWVVYRRMGRSKGFPRNTSYKAIAAFAVKGLAYSFVAEFSYRKKDMVVEKMMTVPLP